MAPLAQMRTMGLFFSPTNPRFLMHTFFDGTSEKAGTHGMPVTRMSYNERRAKRVAKKEDIYDVRTVLATRKRSESPLYVVFQRACVFVNSS